MSKTIVSISDGKFHINGRPTLKGKEWRGHSLEGLLPNARMIQGIFDDENPETVTRWDFPDCPWDPNRNTKAFVEAMPLWREHGLLAFTLGMQGGSPEGYSKVQPWVNSAFAPGGELKPAYMGRLKQILEAADSLGMVLILSLFYFGQDEYLLDETALLSAIDATVEWIVENGYRHVLVEVANEVDIPRYEHELLTPPFVDKVIRRIQERSSGKLDTPEGRLLVGTSYSGGVVPGSKVISQSDMILLHGNGGPTSAQRIAELIQSVRTSSSYRGQPIVINEDDHFDFEEKGNHFATATGLGVSWGYFDYRFPGEKFEDGYQSMPCDWGIRSKRKKAFFSLLQDMTGGDA